IDKKLVDIGIPLGQVIYMPGAILLFLCAAFGMAESFAIAITPVWILTCMIISVVLAIAAPPIAGAALTCYTILFLQLGVPNDAIAVIIALNVILEFVATAVNLFCLQTAMVEISGDLDLLDADCLRK
ncbi:MAG: cation:dicarboxylase symporter family transporter, partial [Clostridia bacterium]|nr:cation:dicarboxylase symporter family transporter [Clostridia bacterium]